MARRLTGSTGRKKAAASAAVEPDPMNVVTTNGQTEVGLRRQSLKEIGGSEATGFNFWILKAALSVRSEAKWMTDADRSQQVSAIIQALRGFAPMDEIEGMMASQAVALHIGTMECLRRAAIPEQSFEVAQGLRKQGANLSRAYMEIVAALDRRRGKGVQQVVRVERVQVAAGGQAIVGNVNAGALARSATEGVGYVAQTKGKPGAPPARLAHDASVGAIVSAVWSKGQDDREALPIASDE